MSPDAHVAVLRQFPAASHSGPPAPLGNRGGFSGARLWRLDGNPPLCLRAWPPAVTSLKAIHWLMIHARRSGLSFVPAVFATRDGRTFVEAAGRLWDLTEWMPGRADFHDRPTEGRLRAACTALARLHQAWLGAASPGRDLCPAVLRRMERYRDWKRLVGSGWRPAFRPDPVRPWAEAAWRHAHRLIDRVPARLAPWLAQPLSPLQPCLCDVWHDHVLFEGDAVTGLIDYGSVKQDHIAVDLARLLGSLAGDDRGMWAVGLEAYRAVRPIAPGDEELARALDETGAVIGLTNWLRWLYHDGREFEDREAVARRLAELVRRAEKNS
ncbi:MAG TPA: phosphotransferase [Gemmataceae bacterium]|nr:phosphotransferase [Gemmataceae bacterium]